MIGLKLYAILGAGMLALLAATNAVSYYKGRESGKIDQLKASVEAYRNRGDIENEVRNSSDVDLCYRLPGSVHSDCDQLRGMD